MYQTSNRRILKGMNTVILKKEKKNVPWHSCRSDAVRKRFVLARASCWVIKAKRSTVKKRSNPMVSAALSLGDYTKPTWTISEPVFPSAGTLKHGVSSSLRANVKITVEIKECTCPSRAGKRPESDRVTDEISHLRHTLELGSEIKNDGN